MAPGHLTAEYLAGRKRSYVLPLRLYLTISLVVWLSLGIQQSLWMARTGLEHVPVTHLDFINLHGYLQVGVHEETFVCKGLPARACERLRHRYLVPVEARRIEATRVVAHLFSNMAYAMFGVVGVFGACSRLAFKRVGLRYGEHLVFAFHVHGIGLLGILAAAVLPAPAGWIALAYGGAYLVLAARRTFGGRWSFLLPRAALLAVADLTLIVAATLLAGLVSALS